MREITVLKDSQLSDGQKQYLEFMLNSLLDKSDAMFKLLKLDTRKLLTEFRAIGSVIDVPGGLDAIRDTMSRKEFLITRNDLTIINKKLDAELGVHLTKLYAFKDTIVDKLSNSDDDFLNKLARVIFLDWGKRLTRLKFYIESVYGLSYYTELTDLLRAMVLYAATIRNSAGFGVVHRHDSVDAIRGFARKYKDLSNVGGYIFR